VSNKLRLNLDDLKVQSFVTMTPAEMATMYGAVETGPLACNNEPSSPAVCGTMPAECGETSHGCTGWAECGQSGAYCYDTNSGCSVPSETSCTYSLSCEPPTYPYNC